MSLYPELVPRSDREARPWEASLVERERSVPESAIKILVIDQDEDACNLIKTELRRGGLTNYIECTNNAKEALRSLKRPGSKKPDIILLETWLGDFSGLDFLCALKRDKELAGIDVIGVSSYADTRLVKRLYSEGLGGFIKKPFAFQSFMAAVRNFRGPRYQMTLTRAI